MILLAITHVFLGITIALPARSTVRGNEVRLDRIATIENATPAELARIGTITLGYVPSPGYSRVIASADVAARLKSAMPDVQCTLAGADRCRVEPEVETVRAEIVRAKALEALTSALASRDAKVVNEGSLTDVQVPKCDTRLELRPVLPSSGLRSGSLSVPVQLWLDGALYMTVGASFRIELFENAVVLARDVRCGEAIGSDALEIRRVCIGSEVQGALLSSAAIQGSVALRDLGRGSVLTDQCVRRARLVRRGDLVQLQVKKGAVVARSTAIAAEDGMFGERIRVTTASSKREISAVVVGRESVEVVLERNR